MEIGKDLLLYHKTSSTLVIKQFKSRIKDVSEINEAIKYLKIIEANWTHINTRIDLIIDALVDSFVTYLTNAFIAH